MTGLPHPSAALTNGNLITPEWYKALQQVGSSEPGTPTTGSDTVATVTQRDLTGLTRIGDITGNNGLNGIFDGNPSTYGSKAATEGYAGIDFGSSVAMHYAECEAPPNGYNNQATNTDALNIYLYASNSAPSSASDGVQRGAVRPFLDTDGVSKLRVYAGDTTGYRYWWIRLVSGSNIAMREVRFYPAVSPDAVSGQATYLTQCNIRQALTQAASEISQFRITINLREKSRLNFYFAANVEHTGPEYSAYTDVLGIAAVLQHRSGADLAALMAASFSTLAVTSNQIYDRTHHYGNLAMPWAGIFDAGLLHQFTILMTAHTLLDPSDYLGSILAEGGAGLNQFVIDVSPTAKLIS